MGKYSEIWDLSRIYTGFNDKGFQEALERAKKLYEEILISMEEGAPLSSKNDFLSFMEKVNEGGMIFSTPETYSDLMDALGMEAGEEALKAREKIRTIGKLRSRAENRLKEMIASASEEALAVEDDEMEAYGFFLSDAKRMAEHLPSGDSLKIMMDMRENGGEGWLELRNQLDRRARVVFDGKEIPLPEARGLATSRDPLVRKKAFQAEISSYESWKEEMAFCLNGIKGEALKELPYKKYDSVCDEMLDVNKMGRETLEALNSSIEKHLEPMREYLRAKARFLGHRHGMPWYDLTAPMGKAKSGISFCDAHDILIPIFTDFSPEVGELMDRAFMEGWIDAPPREGKQSGGICYDLPELKENRILMNYDGSLRGVRVMAHELGHAYHGRCLDDVPMILRDPPTPICETASIMNETVLSNALIYGGESGDREEALYLLDADLMEAVQTVMDIYSRFLFEDRLFEIRKERKLTADEFSRLMLEAQGKVFGNALDGDCMHPYMWMNKVHYYIPEFHYYNYPYYFGMLFSKGLYKEYEKDPRSFPDRYRELLAFTCSGSLEDIGRKADIDITSEGFWEEALSDIDEKCERICGML